MLVRLRAAGINPVDYKLRSEGTIGGLLPAVLGWDGAGVVQEVGRDVTRVRPGDEVYFCDGGFGPTPGAADAHCALEAGQIIGKAVLTMP